MPMYEYECTKCGHRFELIQKFSDRPKSKCPKCRGTLRKLLSKSAIHFKGSGWYVTDYAGKKGEAEPAKSGESAAADPKEGGKPEEKPKPATKAVSGEDKHSSKKGSKS